MYYPGLREHPDHALAGRQFGGRFGSILSFTLAGGSAAASAARPKAARERMPAAPSTSMKLRANMQLAPDAWIAEIRRLADAGQLQQAIENLRLFQRMHPDWPVDEDLRRLEANSRRGSPLAVRLTLGATFALCAVGLQVFDTQTLRVGGIGVWAIGAAAISAIAFVSALRSR